MFNYWWSLLKLNFTVCLIDAIISVAVFLITRTWVQAWVWPQRICLLNVFLNYTLWFKPNWKFKVCFKTLKHSKYYRNSKFSSSGPSFFISVITWSQVSQVRSLTALGHIWEASISSRKTLSQRLFFQGITLT